MTMLNLAFRPSPFLDESIGDRKGHFEKRERPPFSKMAKVVLEATTPTAPPAKLQPIHEERKPEGCFVTGEM